MCLEFITSSFALRHTAHCFYFFFDEHLTANFVLGRASNACQETRMRLACLGPMVDNGAHATSPMPMAMLNKSPENATQKNTAFNII
jgi:hypothetical protein